MFFVVLVDDGEIKVSDVAYHAFEPYHFDVIDAENEEMWLGDVDEAGFGGLQKHI
jgi:hypothetical protein